MRFLISRRWVLFALAVAGLAWLATQLGQWQFDRLDSRKESNELVSRNLDRPPVPIGTVMEVGSGPAREHEWRRVTARGTWDDENTVVLKYQTRDGGAGVDVVTPLRTSEGAAVLVDRGWLATENSGGTRPDLPAASTGEVTVVGWVRRDATGSATNVSERATRAISSKKIAGTLPYPLYGGFLDLESQTPPPATPLGATELPDDDSEGPHFFYGLQWWFFGALAIFGFGYLAYDEWRRARRSEGAQHASVDRKHGAGHE